MTLVIDSAVQGREGAADLNGCRRTVGGEERREHAGTELGGEGGDAQAVGVVT